MPLIRIVPVVTLALALSAPAVGQDHSDHDHKHGVHIEKLYVNANVYTLDPRQPRAAAIAVADGQIVATGPEARLRNLDRYGDFEVIDLSGATVIPGLIDAHGHLGSLGSFGLGQLDLSRAASFDDVIAQVAAAARAADPGAWIVGGRWDHESWPERKLPTHARLSAVTPDNPVWITRVDGHSGLANEAALKRAGISRETTSPTGGEILRGADGAATGVLIDNAMNLVETKIDRAGAGSEALLLKAQEMCLAVGLTGVHDAGVSPADVEVFRRLEREGRLKLRVYGMLSAAYTLEYFARNPPLVGDRFTLRACKLYADGAMGSRGAWLLAPYSDRPTDEAGAPYTGLAVMSPQMIEKLASFGLARGVQVCTHAIGDRGNREVLDAYERALQRARLPEHRFRIEHAQLLSPEDIPRFAELGVIASMQPTHCTTDMRWVADRVGDERARGAYAWASLLRHGARIAAGSDFPVEGHNPMLGFYAAVTRQDLDGKPDGGWQSGERMTRTEALRAFTLDAAYAAFEEERKGSLLPGKLADFVVLNRDIMTCPVGEIPTTRVLRTVIGGETVHTAE